MSRKGGKVRIAFNGLFLTRPHSGMGRYSHGLLPALAKALTNAEILVFVPEPVDFAVPAKVKVVEVPPKRFWLGRGVALDDWERRTMPRAVAEAGASLYHAPYDCPLPDFRIPAVMTVHDMIPWQFPYYRRSARSRAKAKRKLDGIRRADRIVTVSQASAEAISAVAGVPSQLISVAHESVSEAFKKKPTAAAIKAAAKRHRLPRPYVFYIGGFDYRKNVRGLIAAFARSGLAETHDLVIGGTVTAPNSALYADFHRLSILLRQAGIHGQTRLVGDLEEAEKAAVMAGADCFAYPSLAEGFGVPILEALAVGTPVTASSLPVTRELFAGAVSTFDPYDPDDIATILRRAVDSPPKAMITRGRTLARTAYTWEKTAKTVARTYQAALSGNL